jgi:FkbM family methyltransferase
MNRLLLLAHRAFMSVLNKIPYLRLKLGDSTGFNIYFPPDSFGALEENILTKRNVYFNQSSIYDADTIIDLGSHAGSFTIFAILHSKPRAKIIAVEPSEKNVRLLLANIKILEDTIREKQLDVHVLKKAVWIKRGSLTLIDTGWSEGGYVDNVMHHHKVIYVDAVTLDDILDFAMGKIIVKMDIEGAEVPVLASSRSLRKVTKLAVEAHGNEAMLLKLLKLRGYDPKIIVYKLSPCLFKYWLTVKPRIYSSIIAVYRLLVASAFKPTITLVKASRIL